MTTGGFLMPLAIIVYCYSYILYCVFSQRKNLQQSSQQARMIKDKTGNEPAKRKIELETAKAIALMIGLYCMSWLPYTVVAMIGVYGDQSLITPLTSAIPGIFAKASTIYNPIVYVLCLPRFKQRMRSIALKVLCGIEGELVTMECSSPGEYTSDLSTGSYRSKVKRSDMDSSIVDEDYSGVKKSLRIESSSLESSGLAVKGSSMAPTSSIEEATGTDVTNRNPSDLKTADIQVLAASINKNLVMLRALSKQNKTLGTEGENLEQLDELEQMLSQLCTEKA